MIDIKKIKQIKREIIEGQKGWRESGYRPPLGGGVVGKHISEVFPQEDENQSDFAKSES